VEQRAGLERLFRREVDVDRLAIEFGGTFELAQWCKLLRDRGATGHQVAAALGRSEGYVNNLVRILERASLRVLVRWRAEQLPGAGLPHVCATDWLMQTCVLSHDLQDEELERRVTTKSRAREDVPRELQG
jgi:hypothetical protein